MTQLRYVITRPCLLEGSLTIAKYLRPLFPPELAGKPLSLRDDQGRDYSVRMTISGNTLVGMGSVYHALHLNVNDVLLLERTGPTEYHVQGIAKPYSRPQGPAHYGSHSSELPQRRVVSPATPHVREVRLERDYAGYLKPTTTPEALSADFQAPEAPADPPEVLPSRTVQVGGYAPPSEPAAQPAPSEYMPRPPLAPDGSGAVRVDALRLEGGHLEMVAASDLGEIAKPKKIEAVRPSGRVEAHLDGVRPKGYLGRKAPAQPPRTEKLAATHIAEVRQGDSRPHFRDEMLRVEAAQPAGSRIAEVRPDSRPTVPEARADLPSAALMGTDERPTAKLADVLVRGTAAAPTRVDNLRVETTPPAFKGATVTERPAQATRPDAATAQLEELAQLTGYSLEYLGGPETGPVRLHADLGPHSYDVLLALHEQELRHPAFAQPQGTQGQYRALLTWEVENVSAAPRFTREALTALLEHARLAPLTPIDLRGYWNTPSFDLNSVASIAELVSAYLAQRGTFTYVLSTLAQQPAHSLVDPQRLAERLGSGVNVGELRTVLDTLSRPPFMALLPLPGGHYYLRAEVGEVLSELSSYTAGVARRLQGARGRRSS